MEIKSGIPSEALAYWFFRLNGFMTIVNFVVHPDSGSKPRTDVDILGCRFPHRMELLINPMNDYEIFSQFTDKPLIVIAEVKQGTCNLNGPWTNQEKENMQRVLKAVGVYPEGEIENAATSIYNNGYFENELARTSLYCLGSQKNREIERKYPKVPQTTWEEALHFIFQRFLEYRNQKSAHTQWDNHGKKLWRTAGNCNSVDEFREKLGY